MHFEQPAPGFHAHCLRLGRLRLSRLMPMPRMLDADAFHYIAPGISTEVADYSRQPRRPPERVKVCGLLLEAVAPNVYKHNIVTM